MWNKSIAVASRCVIICLLAVLAVDHHQVSARSTTGEHSCLAIKRLLDTAAAPAAAATTQKGEFLVLVLVNERHK